MAAAFIRAGFDAFDVHMSDLLEDRDNLNEYDGFAACGGFSFGDVLGAGGGWAKSILYHTILRDHLVSFLGYYCPNVGSTLTTFCIIYISNI